MFSHVLYVQSFSQSVQSLSRVWLFATPWTAAHQAFLFLTNPWSLLKLISIESVMPSNHLILCRPLLLLSSIFPSIRVFSNEFILHIRWPKYCSFSFSISPSNEYSRLTSFTTDWFELSTMTCPPWVALHSTAHINSIIELCKTFATIRLWSMKGWTF